MAVEPCFLFPAKEDDHTLAGYISNFNKNMLLVQATMPMVPWPADPYSQAVIWQIKDENYGLIEIKCGPEGQGGRFFCLFHKHQVSSV